MLKCHFANYENTSFYWKPKKSPYSVLDRIEGSLGEVGAQCGIVIKVWDWQIQVLKHPPAKVPCITNWHQIEALCEWNKENLHTKVRGIRGFHGILDLCLIPWYCPNHTVGFVPMKITSYHINLWYHIPLLNRRLTFRISTDNGFSLVWLTNESIKL